MYELKKTFFYSLELHLNKIVIEINLRLSSKINHSIGNVYPSAIVLTKFLLIYRESFAFVYIRNFTNRINWILPLSIHILFIPFETTIYYSRFERKAMSSVFRSFFFVYMYITLTGPNIPIVLESLLCATLNHFLLCTRCSLLIYFDRAICFRT